MDHKNHVILHFSRGSGEEVQLWDEITWRAIIFSMDKNGFIEDSINFDEDHNNVFAVSSSMGIGNGRFLKSGYESLSCGSFGIWCEDTLYHQSRVCFAEIIGLKRGTEVWDVKMDEVMSLEFLQEQPESRRRYFFYKFLVERYTTIQFNPQSPDLSNSQLLHILEATVKDKIRKLGSQQRDWLPRACKLVEKWQNYHA